MIAERCAANVGRASTAPLMMGDGGTQREKVDEARWDVPNSRSIFGALDKWQFEIAPSDIKLGP